MLSVEKTMLFLLSKVEQMGAQQFVEIYEHRGYTSTYIRNSLSRLKKEGYITSPSRSWYQVTAAGLAYIKAINGKPARYQEQWDHTWDVVMLEVPEAERKKRDLFRTALGQLGYGLLYNSVYISPWNYQTEVAVQIQKLELEGRVSILQGRFLEGSITPQRAQTIWELSKIAGLYKSKALWLQQEFIPAMQKALQAKQPLLLFLLYLQMGEELSGLFMADPYLPDELLPEHWTGKAITLEMSGYMQTLAQAVPPDSDYAPFIK
ncbi:PaaX family transcriptional regulator C-terminal domain-containing protein [Paenibacillus sp. MMS20-IR301]|uniref:PaaX family transcriptional regulator C-terminal domain-containing protein n=1 Tax=Paenibacillus sp. MMS20-IR301 TaxID=2895946 RepID=UPI0028E478B4|nr:PaaX family transcriptional regulator C-terminal domain-containing protein [Paenibacillus sp. MMS20-IR301]WNS44741.1 PaaX family transcriptional regulator C-terminal domain-containing protein [Paenibacillus sp. MMS20-IR301]